MNPVSVFTSPAKTALDDAARRLYPGYSVILQAPGFRAVGAHVEIVHRIGGNWSQADRDHFLRLGVVVPLDGRNKDQDVLGTLRRIGAFEIAESDPRWPAVEEWIRGRHFVDIVATRFSPEEVAEAKWLVLSSSHHGYPCPEGYAAVTYSEICETCGWRGRQIAPFRMRGEPRWGRRGLMQLNWVYDEVFAKPEVWKRFFEPRGVECLPVLDAKGHALKTVVQLVSQGEFGVDAKAQDTCLACGASRYVFPVRGRFSRLREEPSGELVRTSQFFGSGFRPILVSQRLGRELLDNEIRDAFLAPVEGA